MRYQSSLNAATDKRLMRPGAGTTGGTSVPTTDQVQAAFDAGTLTAKMGLGAIFGVVGGALGVIGSVLSFGKPKQQV